MPLCGPWLLGDGGASPGENLATHEALPAGAAKLERWTHLDARALLRVSPASSSFSFDDGYSSVSA